MVASPKTSDALLTDLYCLTMAADYVHEGTADDLVTFELTVRGPRVLTVAGIEEALAFLEGMRFGERDLRWLADLDCATFDEPVLARLRELRFSGSIWAPREGTIAPPGMPLLRLTAPRLEATLVETPLLAALNYSLRVATNATTIVRCAGDRPVWDFSMRRLDGLGAGHAAARAAYLAGFAGTATTAAARDLGIPVTGTMAHQKVMARGPAGELDVFCDQLRARTGGATLLVDTYDPVEGVRRAIAAQRLTGAPLKAIRIDSGDHAALTEAARRMLDEAGLRDTLIILSGDLDAAQIAGFVAAGVPAQAFGVGTRLRAGEAIGAVYKLVEQHDEDDAQLRYAMKLSPGKQTDPGAHQVTRRPDGTHVLHLAGERIDGVALLAEVMRDGRRTAQAPDLADDRRHAAAERARTAAAQPAAVVRSPGLRALRARLNAEFEREGDLTMSSATALIAVDVQHDFLPGGALGVPGGDAVVEPLVRAAGDVELVVRTRDAHTADHCSFEDQGGPWPVHCVAGTHGAELHPRIAALEGPVVDKGTTQGADAYSGFDGTGLAETLREAGVGHVLVGGLATDYCVKATVLHALEHGFATTVLTDAIAAVEVQDGDGRRALEEMVAAGAQLSTSGAGRTRTSV